MNKNVFDGIIACGDSFTWYDKNKFEETWPYLLGQHYGVPVVNLGRGGASNFEIAFQPLQSDSYLDNETFMGEFSPKNPLVIFGITTKYRIPMLWPTHGVMGSISNILPEEFGYNKERYGFDDRIFVPMALSMLALDRYDIADYNAIKTMARLQTLMPHATVMWGSIHTQHIEPVLDNETDKISTMEGGFYHDRDRMKDYYQRLNNEGIENICFNAAIDWMPVESMNFEPTPHDWVPTGDYFINKGNKPGGKDMHPNAQGIQRITDEMIRCIDYRFS